MANAAGRALAKSRRRGKKAAEAEAPDPIDGQTEIPYTEHDADTATTDTEEDHPMSTDTDTFQEYDAPEYQTPDEATDETDTDESDSFDDIDFLSATEALPDDYKPSRPSAGRKRKPTQFDDLVVEVKGQGYRKTPFATKEQADYIAKQLNKAKTYRGLGMDLTINHETQCVEWQTRDLQDRKRKTDAEGGDDVNVGSVDSTDPEE